MSGVPPAVRAARSTSESGFQRAVIDLARRCGFLVGHIHDSRRQVAPGRFVGDKDAAGLPDLLLVRDGVLLFVELKGPSGRLRPAQQVWLDALAVVAGHAPEHVGVQVWKPADWADVEMTLMRGRG